MGSFTLYVTLNLSFLRPPSPYRCHYRNSEGTKLLKNGSIEKSQASMATSLSKVKHKILLDIYAYDVMFAKEPYTVLSLKSDGDTSSNDSRFYEDAVSVSHFQMPDETLVNRRSSSFLFTGCCKTLKELAVWKLLR